jgi:hypothetical protein
MTPLERQRVVSKLIQFDLSVGSYADPADRDSFFTMLLRDGFAGYSNMSSDDLRNEAFNRGIEI